MTTVNDEPQPCRKATTGKNVPQVVQLYVVPQEIKDIFLVLRSSENSFPMLL